MGEAKNFAIKVLPKFEKVFAKYPLSDEFAYSIDFTSLYTELAGVLSIWIEEHELQ